MKAKLPIWSHAMAALAVLPVPACEDVDTPAGSARIVRRDHVMRAPTDAHVERYIEDRIPSMADRAVQARERERFEPVPVSDHLPALASMMADALDHLWVEEYEPPSEESPGVIWCVFDPDGEVLGFVETPEGLLIYDIGEDYILGRVTDEMDVEFIQLWPLERLPAA